MTTRKILYEELTMELRPEQEGTRKVVAQSIQHRGVSHYKSFEVRMNTFIMKLKGQCDGCEIKEEINGTK